MNRLLCDIPEAAHALSVGRSKMYDLMAAGAIDSVKIGQRRLIVVESLAGYVAGLAHGDGRPVGREQQRLAA